MCSARSLHVCISLSWCVAAGLLAFLVELETLAALVSIGTLATFFMLALGVLWRRFHAPDGPAEPGLVAQLLGVTLFGAGAPSLALLVMQQARQFGRCWALQPQQALRCLCSLSCMCAWAPGRLQRPPS